MAVIHFTTRLKRTLLWLLIASLSLAAALAVLAFISGDLLGLQDWRLHATNLAFALSSLTALGCALSLDKGRARLVCLIGLPLSVACFVLHCVEIWVDWSLVDAWELYRWGGTAVVWSVWCPHVALLGFASPGRALAWVITATRACALLLGLLLTTIIWSDGGDNEFVFRALGVLATLTLLGTITLPVLHWIAAMRKRESVVTAALRVSLTCPRCGQTEAHDAGRSACSRCGLGIRLEIEEERCPRCGYSLYMLTSDRCPECGATVYQAAQEEA